jgi:hypothetical protein
MLESLAVKIEAEQINISRKVGYVFETVSDGLGSKI